LEKKEGDIYTHIWAIAFFIDFTDSFLANKIDLAIFFCAKKILLEKGTAPFISYIISYNKTT